MKKSFYSILAMGGMAMSSAFAQAVIDHDVVFDTAFDEGDYGGESDAVITGCTVTMAADCFNTCGLPFLNDGTVSLIDGGKVKFFDSPDTAYPDPEAEGVECGGYMVDANSKTITAMPFNWIIEGKGNEIWLDSNCTMGGTISGDENSEVTIYIGNQNTMAYNCWFQAKGTEFKGTMKIKVQDAYKADTVTLRYTAFGNSTDGVSYTKTSGQWAAMPYTIDVTEAENLFLRSTTSTSAWPNIVGKCDIYTGSSYVFWRNSTPAVYEGYIHGGVTSRDFEIYCGATTTFAGVVASESNYNYLRSGQLLLINSQEPSFSGSVHGFSGRNKDSRFGGNGYIDCGVAGKEGNTVNIYPGAEGPNSIGTLTMKSLWLYHNNGVAFDFGGNGESDKIVMIDSANFSGANTRVWLNLMDEFFQNPKVGNYAVLDGKCVTAMTPVNDTIGYSVVDSVLTYVNVNTGDSITYITSIFPKYGTNREIDTLAYWGLGTGTGASYVPSPNKISAEDWAANYSAAARAEVEARVFMPYTNDTIRYTGHNLTSTDIPLKGAYDYIYNFNLEVKNNAMSYIQETGDTLNIAKDFFNFTFKSIDEETGETVYRFTTNEFPIAKANGDSTFYWFDFTNFFTKGMIKLCSRDLQGNITVPADDEAPVNGQVTAIQTILKETHAVQSRNIYTIDGKRVNQYVKGLNIVTTRYTDGTIETKKVFFLE